MGFDLTLRPDRLELPLTWKRPRLIFVNSMSDLFHENVPDDFVVRTFQTMRTADWHTFQVLTKRPERAAELAPALEPWPANVWMGTSVENQRWNCRIDSLRRIPLPCASLASAARSAHPEPGRNPWVIVGANRPKARPMKESGPTVSANSAKRRTPFFFKQWGALTARAAVKGRRRQLRGMGNGTGCLSRSQHHPVDRTIPGPRYLTRQPLYGPDNTRNGFARIVLLLSVACVSRQTSRMSISGVDPAHPSGNRFCSTIPGLRRPKLVSPSALKLYFMSEAP
jgi:protein gp37